MAKRTRGRSYPALSLREAVDKARQFYDVERNARVSAEDAVQTWGYRGLNGASQRVLSAVRQYGLLDDSQGDVKISQRALAILLDEEHTEDYQQALREAVREPAVFAEILDEYTDGLPSETSLISYLVRRREFSDEAARKVNSVLRDTLEYVRERTRDLAPDRSGAHTGGVEQEPAEPAHAASPVRVEAPSPSPSRAPGQVDMKYEFALSEHTTATLLISGTDFGAEDLDLLEIFLTGAKKAIARTVRQRESSKRDGGPEAADGEPQA